MDKITAVGLDLAKQIIQVHAVDSTGRVVLRKVVRRERLFVCTLSARFRVKGQAEEEGWEATAAPCAPRTIS